MLVIVTIARAMFRQRQNTYIMWMGTTFGELQLVMRGSYSDSFTRYEARFNLRQTPGSASDASLVLFHHRRFLRGGVFHEAYKTVLCDAL